MRKVTKISPSGNAFLPKHQMLRVAAYARVSTGSDEQLQSFAAQVEHYTNFINSNPEWEFAGVYADEGISGTKKENRPELMLLLSDCESGKIDFIITKSISRFARNTTDVAVLSSGGYICQISLGNILPGAAPTTSVKLARYLQRIGSQRNIDRSGTTKVAAGDSKRHTSKREVRR